MGAPLHPPPQNFMNRIRRPNLPPQEEMFMSQNNSNFNRPSFPYARGPRGPPPRGPPLMPMNAFPSHPGFPPPFNPNGPPRHGFRPMRRMPPPYTRNRF